MPIIRKRRPRSIRNREAPALSRTYRHRVEKIAADVRTRRRSGRGGAIRADRGTDLRLPRVPTPTRPAAKEPAHDVCGGRLVATVTDPVGKVPGILENSMTTDTAPAASAQQMETR